VLLERESELKLLGDLLAEVGSSGGKVVLIRGEAGIGKSSLVREFLNIHADDAHIYFGACDDLLTPQPLGPPEGYRPRPVGSCRSYRGW